MSWRKFPLQHAAEKINYMWYLFFFWLLLAHESLTHIFAGALLPLLLLFPLPFGLLRFAYK